MTDALDPRAIARALDGEAHGFTITAPGPGHSAADRSMSVKIDQDAPNGFLVHSFAGDNPIACRDHVRLRACLDPFKPTLHGGRLQRAPSPRMDDSSRSNLALPVWEEASE